MKRIILIIPIILFSCSYMVPKHFASLNEAYPSSNFVECSTLPTGSCRNAFFNYTFEDVFNSSVNALSFAQINVQEQKKKVGIYWVCVPS